MNQTFKIWLGRVNASLSTKKTALVLLVVVFSLASLFFLQAPSDVVTVKNLETLVRKDQPLKKYRLSNGVEICFVQDKKQTRSSAAVAVQAGSWDDYPDAQGIAHFLEHMLFLGSEHYPQEDGFSSHLSSHQGSSNAYTSSDSTVYYMSCAHDGFLEGLDRFCDLIARPVLSPNASDREKNAIEEELALKKKNDLYLAHLAFTQTLADGHPAKLFHIGNLETLKNVHTDTLRKWHREHYNAPSVKLTVVSPFSPSIMLPSIKKRLLQLPPKEKEVNRADNEIFMINYDEANRPSKHRITMPSKTDSYRLQFIWPLVPLSQEYYSLNSSAISQVICHTDIPGFHSWIQEKGWCKNFYAHQIGPGNKLILICDFLLTEEGYRNKNKIEKMLTALLERYAALKAPPAFLYQEHLHTSKQEYIDSVRVESSELAPKIAQELLYEPIETYPTNTYLRSPEIYSSIAIQCKQMLETPPVVVEIIPPSAIEQSGIELNRVHPQIPQLQFHVANEPRKVQVSQEAKAKVGSFQLFPSRNPYIRYKPLKEIPEKKFQLPASLTPDFESKSLRLHYLQESFLGGRQSSFIFRISNPFSGDHSPQKVALENLWQFWISNHLEKIIQQASRAGYEITFEPLYGEIEVTISGWSSRIKTVVDDFLKALQLGSSDNEREFAIAKQGLLSSLQERKNNPLSFTHDQLLSKLYKEHTTIESLIDQVQQITPEQLDRFTEDFFSAVYLDLTAVSMLPRPKITKYAGQWRNLFVSTIVQRNKVHTPTRLDGDRNQTFFTPTQDKGETLFLYLEHGKTSDLELLASLLLLNAPIHNAYFDQLRTKEQMAYVVASRAYETKNQNVASLFYISSNSYPCSILEEKTNAFISSFVGSLKKQVPVTEFLDLKKALIEKLQEKPDSAKKIAHTVLDFVRKEETKKVNPKDLIPVVQSLEYLDWLSIVKKAYEDPISISMKTGVENNREK